MNWSVVTSCLVAAGLALASPASAAKAPKATKAAKATKAPPAASSVVTVGLGSDACDGDKVFNPGIRSKIYAKNNSKTRSVLVNIKYDSNPGGLKFAILDNNKAAYTEQYPLHHAFQLEPGERKVVGCATTFRTDSSGDAYMRVPITASLDTAAYVDAGQSAPPEEDAASFGRFMTQALPDRTVCLSKTPAYLYLANTHPGRAISFKVSMVDKKGRQAEERTIDLPPMDNERIGCSKADNGNLAADHILSATFLN